MEREIRNLLERTTQQARRLLEEEYGRQIEGTFDILPDGTIHPEPGGHLTAEERFFRGRLVAAIEHRRALGESAQDSVSNFLRECAFTFLNRIVALRMLEARAIIKPSVSKGEESSGFTNEFLLLAPGLKSLPDKGYRLYLESLFDEIGRDVGVLFDRTDLAGQLWPDRPRLLELLEILNNPGLESVWVADETIGWVYQYFNSDDERRQMRADSAAPRSSREMAVRNQFFTPRYVVEFLTDNTLGRIWYEMRRGQTLLKERCRYLVRRQNEYFLQPGEEPFQVETRGERAQEEILREGMPIPCRAPKDPRAIRVLDPACGSGHFLLYCFDLLEVIYEEAWEAGVGTLRQEYSDKDDLKRATPELILRHNLHGIDIDPRAAQICSLALWMRAQRAWNNLSRAERQPIRKTNVVVAEPMPGEADLLAEFCETLQPELLGQLVRDVFERMKLAGDAGSLLRIEADIAQMVEEAKRQWLAEEAPTDRAGNPLLFAKSSQRTIFELERVTADFWTYAEQQVFDALDRFATSASSASSFRRRLFADDAERGFAFIDQCAKRFDVILMNPPFGLSTDRVFTMLTAAYPGAYNDVFAAFAVRALGMLAPGGCTGAISSRSFLVAPRMESFRRLIFLPNVRTLADLGLGVMDSAYVESCAYALFPGHSTTDDFDVFDLRSDPDSIKGSGIAAWGTPLVASRRRVLGLPLARVLYTLSATLARIFEESPTFEPGVGTAREGMKTFDNFRFLRLRWEVPEQSGVRQMWSPITKGGEFSFYVCDHNLLVNWGLDGKELQEINRQKNGSTAQVRQASDYWGRPGVTYSGRSAKGFSARILPAGLIFSGRGPAVLSTSDVSAHYILGWLNSRLTRGFIHLQASFSYFTTGAIKRLPWQSMQPEVVSTLLEATDAAIKAQIAQLSTRETSAYFKGPMITSDVVDGFRASTSMCVSAQQTLAQTMADWDEAVDVAYATDSTKWASEVLSDPSDDDEGEDSQEEETDNSLRAYAFSVVSYAVGCIFGRWQPGLWRERERWIRDLDPLCALPQRSHGPGNGHAKSMLIQDQQVAGALVEELSAQVTAFGLKPEYVDQLAEVLAVPHLGVLFGSARADGFWHMHLRQYSKSRRAAPIYWFLSISSTRFSIWLYYHRLTRDTFWRVLNDFVKPKVAQEERRLSGLRSEAGEAPSPSQRRAIQEQESFVAELATFRDDIETVAPLWNPNLDDGVLLNFAPLWKLVPQLPSWQRDLRQCWQKLCCGDYDWAHIAMHLWPERAVPKCAEDRSLAIAHGLEGEFWEQQSDGKWKARKRSVAEVGELIQERSSKVVKASLDRLMAQSAGVPATKSGRRGIRRNS